MTACTFCGGACGRVCRGLGYQTKRRVRPPSSAVPRPTAAPGGDYSPLPPPEAGAELRAAIEEYIDALDSLNASIRRTSLTRLRQLVGKPLRTDAKPWLAEGISERTYYRRKAKETAK